MSVIQCKVKVLKMIFLLILLTSFIEPGAMQPELTVQPGNTILVLNQMSNATFHCLCDLCETPPYWSVGNEGQILSTDSNSDEIILAQRGITYSSSGISAMISVPNTVENNNTQISCVGFIFGGSEFSNPVEVFIIGPPLSPDPVIVINSSSQLEIQWEIPYSHADYPIVSYNIQIVNVSSGNVLDSLLEYNETSYMYTFEEDVQYCQILTVNVTAVSAVGPSEPGSVSRGFPIAPRSFQSDAKVELTFQENDTPMARISFVPPLICDYQMARYTLAIQDITVPNSPSMIVRESFYSGPGGNGYIVEFITSGLQINHNYTLFVSVVDDDLNEEASTTLNFSSIKPISTTTMVYATTIFQQTSPEDAGSIKPTSTTTMVYATTNFQQTSPEDAGSIKPTSTTTMVHATTNFQQTSPEDAGCCNSLSLQAALMCLILLLILLYF